GVFAKTDVQNLISRTVPVADIAASIFEAVAGQTINSLARGCTVEPRILFSGGPLTYISCLGESFARLLKIDRRDIILPERAELFTALGTALAIPDDARPVRISEIVARIGSGRRPAGRIGALTPLFGGQDDYGRWEKERPLVILPEGDIVDGETCCLGIDSGSTTTKIVLISDDGSLRYHFYRGNNGSPLNTVIEGLSELSARLNASGKTIRIAGAAVTGYGEELIKSALGIEYSLVETVAHFIAARRMEPEVSFILDIGGQDIKAIFVRNGVICNIEINEACSSGCGSFIENFAQTLGYSPSAFAGLAARSSAPYDLGSRCTVFMNSKVKQAVRDGATIPDLSAGLAYSVIKNCLNKVLRIKNTGDIGDAIVVQGGTFRNTAVFRSLEMLSGKKVVVSDKPELMGALGAALYAQERSATDGSDSTFIGLDNLGSAAEYTTRRITCGGCANKCEVDGYHFSHGVTCYSGNKCEKIFAGHTRAAERGDNIFTHKHGLLFGCDDAGDVP
ncbi:MAG TPA: acyl-CoA dehydratase activase, partial [Acidobacteriota bacterium]|nr:acyl-CoA dehydratase activase [Acidobacteriota bacterium]